MKKSKQKPIAIQINASKCAHFAACHAAAKCKEKAILQAFPRAVPKIKRELCTLCGECIPACPTHSIAFVYA